MLKRKSFYKLVESEHYDFENAATNILVNMDYDKVKISSLLDCEAHRQEETIASHDFYYPI